MSNETNKGAKVGAKQVDPGYIDWGMVTVITDSQIAFQVVSTRTDNGTYLAQHEYWFGCDGAAAALAATDNLKLRHHGSFSWDDYGAIWQANAAPGRSETSVSMANNVVYEPPASFPEVVFDGAIETSSGEVPMRLELVADGNSLVRVTWFHKGGSNVGYLVNNDATVTLVKRPVSWDPAWQSYTWP
ncbi:MAG TPA: hypothetical protein ENK23_05730, partial [Sorangium sp.]|nr:hypothetical protein [Sorangium sp.]